MKTLRTVLLTGMESQVALEIFFWNSLHFFKPMSIWSTTVMLFYDALKEPRSQCQHFVLFFAATWEDQKSRWWRKLECHIKPFFCLFIIISCANVISCLISQFIIKADGWYQHSNYRKCYKCEAWNFEKPRNIVVMVILDVSL